MRTQSEAQVSRYGRCVLAQGFCDELSAASPRQLATDARRALKPGGSSPCGMARSGWSLLSWLSRGRRSTRGTSLGTSSATSWTSALPHPGVHPNHNACIFYIVRYVVFVFICACSCLLLSAPLAVGAPALFPSPDVWPSMGVCVHPLSLGGTWIPARPASRCRSSSAMFFAALGRARRRSLFISDSVALRAGLRFSYRWIFSCGVNRGPRTPAAPSAWSVPFDLNVSGVPDVRGR
mgnify:CR=1 FL=1